MARQLPVLQQPANLIREKPIQLNQGKRIIFWVYAGGTKTAGGGVNDNFVTLTWTSSGNRNVKVTYTDGACTQQTTYPVTVYHIQPGLTGPQLTV